MFKRFACVGCGPVPEDCLGTVCRPCKDKLTASRLQFEEILRVQIEREPRYRPVTTSPVPLREAA